MLIGIILVGLIVLSTGGYAIMNNESGGTSFIKYNDIKFYNQNGYWIFNYDGQQFSTEYNHEQTKNIVFRISANLAKYNKKVLYFVTESGQPNNEIYKNLYVFIKKYNMACLDNQTCNGDFPIKNCSTDNIIIVKIPSKNETEGIFQDQNCIFIRAYENNQTKFADAFLFNILGIE